MEESATAIEVQSRTNTLTYLEIVGSVGPFWNSMPSVTRTRAEKYRMKKIFLIAQPMGKVLWTKCSDAVEQSYSVELEL